jgi:hypothetical protein
MPCSSPAISAQTISNLAYLFLTNPKLNYSDWRLLHTWLIEIPYIKPADRELYTPLMQLLTAKYGFKIARDKSYFIESHISIQDQKELSQWIPD